MCVADTKQRRAQKLSEELVEGSQLFLTRADPLCVGDSLENNPNRRIGGTVVLKECGKARRMGSRGFDRGLDLTRDIRFATT